MEPDTLAGKPLENRQAADLSEHRERVRRLREYHQRDRAILGIEPCHAHAGWAAETGASALPALDVLLGCRDCDVRLRDSCAACSGLAHQQVPWPCRTIELLDGLVPRDEAKEITRAHESGDHSACPADCPARMAAMERARDDGMPG